jgi:outer membrane protein assembly factor BamB
MRAFTMTKRKIIFLTYIFACMGLNAPAADWPTFNHDPQRSGWAVEETSLRVENVSGLKLLWKTQIKNEAKSLTALTSPIVAEGVTTEHGARNLVYVAGSSSNLTALNAETGEVVWTQDFAGQVTSKYEGMWLCPNNLNATPTLDRERGLIYVIAADGKFYGLDLGTGATRFGPVQFVQPFAKDWSLNLSNSIVYTAISQNCGGAPSGIYSIAVRDPLRPVIRELIVAKRGGGIWGRAGVAVGENGKIYASTGDGKFDPAQGEFSSSIFAASPTDLKIVDYYSPFNFEKITKFDLDISAASVIWFRDHGRSLVAGGGKEGAIYLLDAESMGAADHRTPLLRLKVANDPLAFEMQGIWGELSTWQEDNGTTWLYVPIWGPPSKEAPSFPVTHGENPHGSIMAFRLGTNPKTQMPALDPAWISSDFDVPEPVAIANGVIFALSTGENTMQTNGSPIEFGTGQKILSDKARSLNTHNAVLVALNAKTGEVLYQSGDAMSSWVHFSGLAIAGGHVYAVDQSSTLYCFGLPAGK